MVKPVSSCLRVCYNSRRIYEKDQAYSLSTNQISRNRCLRIVPLTRVTSVFSLILHVAQNVIEKAGKVPLSEFEQKIIYLKALDMDQVMQLVDPAKQFSKDSIRFVKRCTKPDRKEFQKIAIATAIGFAIMEDHEKIAKKRCIYFM
ncbi:hypothetical protein KUTeg_015058 [Tegillarca granosa]|uniref:Uncharacterized protein n=1 Tax=Tegillarca granosa TaxID=220873 RepID=A0ABQ9EPQ5_TEGGR|nr:hypothetical protein KUTeg_015058 [Tegillarca granosa]